MASLYKNWEEAHRKKTLPSEWKTWEACRAWAIENRYKMEYGYKGEFSPQGCLKTMPGYVEPAQAAKKDEKGDINAGKKTNTRSRRRDGV